MPESGIHSQAPVEQVSQDDEKTRFERAVALGRLIHGKLQRRERMLKQGRSDVVAEIDRVVRRLREEQNRLIDR